MYDCSFLRVFSRDLVLSCVRYLFPCYRYSLLPAKMTRMDHVHKFYIFHFHFHFSLFLTVRDAVGSKGGVEESEQHIFIQFFS